MQKATLRHSPQVHLQQHRKHAQGQQTKTNRAAYIHSFELHICILFTMKCYNTECFCFICLENWICEIQPYFTGGLWPDQFSYIPSNVFTPSFMFCVLILETGRAIKFAVDHVFSSTERGSRVKNRIAVVVTDGKSQDDVVNMHLILYIVFFTFKVFNF